MGVTFCRFCFMVGTLCDCHPEVSSAPTSYRNPPRHSYAAKTTVTSTSASTSAVGVPTAADPPPGYAMLPPSMDASCQFVGWGWCGKGGDHRKNVVQVPGLCQVWPQLNPQWPVIPAVPEAAQSTPYRQQVPAPWVPQPNTGTRLCTAVETARPSTTASSTTSTTTSNTTSTASDMEAGTRERSRERSSLRESRDQPSLESRSRSSTRGSRKRRRGIYSWNPMDDLDRYIPRAGRWT